MHRIVVEDFCIKWECMAKIESILSPQMFSITFTSTSLIYIYDPDTTSRSCILGKLGSESFELWWKWCRDYTRQEISSSVQVAISKIILFV